MLWHSVVFCVLLSSAYNSCDGAKIVAAYGATSKSMMFAIMPALEALAERGHEVTVITPFKGISKGIGKEVFLSSLASTIETDLDWFAMQKAGPKQIFDIMPYLKDVAVEACNHILSNPEFQKIVKTGDVDVFIVDSMFHEFLFPVFDHFGIPFVTHSSSSAVPANLAAMGAPLEYASVPSIISDFTDQMTFFQRLTNALSCELFNLIRKYYILTHLNEVIQSHFPGVKPISEVEGEASICLMNVHPVTNWPRSLPPTMVPIGALHTRPAQPLTEELKSFADGAEDGLVVFTLGSLIPVSSMPKETIDIFLRVFSKLPQRILWKWEAEIPSDLPKNIKMMKWLPQQDLLGHPNTKVFISHGGLLGTQEAAYHGVPILGLPFGNDQKGNIVKAQYEGWGLLIEWDKIDDQNLYDSIIHLLHDSSVRANASRVSTIMQDEPMSGKDIAVYWIEYVIRHRDAKHLRVSARNLPFYQIYMLDVLAFVIMIVFSICLISYWILSKLFHSFTAEKVKQKMK